MVVGEGEGGGGVAEAFAEVKAPGAGAIAAVVRVKRAFARLGGPAEFAFGAAEGFAHDEGFPRPAERVTEACPDEVEDFVGEDAAEFVGIGEEGGIEDDAALGKEAGGLDFEAAARAGFEFAAMVGEVGLEVDFEGAAVERRQEGEEIAHHGAGAS